MSRLCPSRLADVARHRPEQRVQRTHGRGSAGAAGRRSAPESGRAVDRPCRSSTFDVLHASSSTFDPPRKVALSRSGGASSSQCHHLRDYTQVSRRILRVTRSSRVQSAVFAVTAPGSRPSMHRSADPRTLEVDDDQSRFDRRVFAPDRCCGRACCSAPAWRSPPARGACAHPHRAAGTARRSAWRLNRVAGHAWTTSSTAVRRGADGAARRPPGADRDRRQHPSRGWCWPTSSGSIQPDAAGTSGCARASATRTARPVQVQDVATALTDVQPGRRLVRRRVLSRVAHRRARSTRPASPCDTDAPGPGARLPDVQHPDHPGGRQHARGPAVRASVPVRMSSPQPTADTGTYTLERNENYWGARATRRVGAGPLHARRDPAAVVALRSGEIDVIDSITPDSADQIAGLAGVAHRPCRRRAAQSAVLQLPQTARPARSPTRGCAGRSPMRSTAQSLIDNVMQGSATRVARGHPARLWTGPSRPASTPTTRTAPRPNSIAAASAICALKIIWESGEFAADTDIMESVVRDALGGGRQRHTAAVRARRRHRAVAPRAKPATGTSSATATPSPTGLALDHHAGHVRRYRREGSHPGLLPRLRLPRGHRSHHRGVRRARPGHAATPCWPTRSGSIWDTCPCHAVVRAEGRPRQARPASTASACAPPTPTTSPP